MSMDYYDRQKMENLHKKTRQVVEDAIKREISQSDRKTADAFNRIASALENLTEEVRALRADLNPSLDKPRKMPAPKGGS